MTNDEMDTLLDATADLPSEQAVRAIEAEVLRRVKEANPAPPAQDDEALELLRRIISTWESPWTPGADPMVYVLAEARAMLAKRGAA